MNVSQAIYPNCIYSQCNENKTVVDIPVELLEGYQGMHYFINIFFQ